MSRADGGKVAPIAYPLEAGGVMTRIVEAGTGEISVLFIHGLGARADRWRDTVVRYASLGFRCIALDLPGHGFAEKSTAFEYTVPSYTRFVDSVIAELGLGEMVLVGTSLGGHIAATLAITNPERYRALVLVGSVGLVPLSEAIGVAVKENIRQVGRTQIEGKLKFVVADPALVTDAWIEEEWRINNSPGAADAFESLGEYFHKGINADVVGDQLAKLGGALPMMLVWGASDKAVPVEIGHAAATLLGLDGPLLIDGAGHAPYFEQPSAFDELVVPFLEKYS